MEKSNKFLKTKKKRVAKIISIQWNILQICIKTQWKFLVMHMLTYQTKSSSLCSLKMYAVSGGRRFARNSSGYNCKSPAPMSFDLRRRPGLLRWNCSAGGYTGCRGSPFIYWAASNRMTFLQTCSGETWFLCSLYSIIHAELVAISLSLPLFYNSPNHYFLRAVISKRNWIAFYLWLKIQTANLREWLWNSSALNCAGAHSCMGFARYYPGMANFRRFFLSASERTSKPSPSARPDFHTCRWSISCLSANPVFTMTS